MSNFTSDRVGVDSPARTLAVRAGRLVEQILIERGIDAARQSGASIATMEQVASSIDEGLLEQLHERLNLGAQDPETNERRKFA